MWGASKFSNERLGIGAGSCAAYDGKSVVPWTIGVDDDGTSRVGYAAYVCEVLREEGALGPTDSVRIVDYARFMSAGGTARDASLGHVECSTGRDLGV